MQHIYLLTLTIGIIIFEFLKCVQEIHQINKKEKYVNGFMEHFIKYVNSNGRDQEADIWLTMNSIKMQRQMGGLGIVGYQPPFQNYIHNNYLVVVNGLDEIKKELTNGLGCQHVQMVQDAIIRYIGELNNHRESIIEEMKNPIVLFRNGVQWIFVFPIQLLKWFGVISTGSFIKLSDNLVIRFLSGVFSLITFISTVVSLVIGWDAFVGIINKWRI